MSWRGEWKGWEGFHFDLTRRTLLGELAPNVTNLPPVPMTLENVGSSRDMMFMESAAPLQAQGPVVEAGFQVGRPILQRRMTWAFGLFTDGVGGDFGDATEDFGRAVVRITGLPIDTSPPVRACGYKNLVEPFPLAGQSCPYSQRLAIPLSFDRQVWQLAEHLTPPPSPFMAFIGITPTCPPPEPIPSDARPPSPLSLPDAAPHGGSPT